MADEAVDRREAAREHKRKTQYRSKVIGHRRLTERGTLTVDRGLTQADRGVEGLPKPSTQGLAQGHTPTGNEMFYENRGNEAEHTRRRVRDAAYRARDELAEQAAQDAKDRTRGLAPSRDRAGLHRLTNRRTGRADPTIFDGSAGRATSGRDAHHSVRRSVVRRSFSVENARLADSPYSVVRIATRWKSQFDTPKGILGCFDAAKEMTLSDAPRGVRLIGNTKDGRLETSTGLDAAGHVIPSTRNAERAVAYINQLLDRNLRVLVGVNYPEEDRPEDRIGTRHFVTIVGRSYEPAGPDLLFGLIKSPHRTVYEYYDPGFTNLRQDNGAIGKLYIDNLTGILFKPAIAGRSGLMGKPYEVTHVRIYHPTSVSE